MTARAGVWKQRREDLKDRRALCSRAMRKNLTISALPWKSEFLMIKSQSVPTRSSERAESGDSFRELINTKDKLQYLLALTAINPPPNNNRQTDKYC